MVTWGGKGRVSSLVGGEKTGESRIGEGKIRCGCWDKVVREGEGRASVGKGRLGARLMGKGKDGEGRTREWESRCAESTVKSM